MRTMEFTIEDTEALKPGMEVNVSEGGHGSKCV